MTLIVPISIRSVVQSMITPILIKMDMIQIIVAEKVTCWIIIVPIAGVAVIYSARPQGVIKNEMWDQRGSMQREVLIR